MRLPQLTVGVAIWPRSPPWTFSQELSELLPNVLHRSDPTYPPIARTAHLEGDVEVKLTTDGESVTNARVKSGHPLLQ